MTFPMLCFPEVLLETCSNIALCLLRRGMLEEIQSSRRNFISLGVYG